MSEVSYLAKFPSAVVIFPDYRGRVAGGPPFAEDTYKFFVHRVREVLSDEVLIIPAFNGSDTADLGRMYGHALQDQNFRPVRSRDQSRGVVGALEAAYESLVRLPDEWRKCPVVRMDTEEHSHSEIDRLMRVVESGADMAIGDLDLADGKLVPGTPDALATHLVPETYAWATNGKLRLSCAHGFQVFRSAQVCIDLLPTTLRLLSLVEKLNGTPVTWGLDGAMALSAVSAGHEVRIVPIPATQVRNRPLEKVEAQMRAARLLALAYRQMVL